MGILEHPTEWLLPSQALELARSGLSVAEQHMTQGEHERAAIALQEVCSGLLWQVMHQQALAKLEEE